jgi:hypothetical protein
MPGVTPGWLEKGVYKDNTEYEQPTDEDAKDEGPIS